MPITKAVPRWHKRLQEIPSKVDQILIPSNGELAQDEEWCEVVVAGKRRRVRFHDYHKIYEVPGFYERLFYRRLKCCSPTRTVGLLMDVFGDTEENAQQLRVLDLGAGNGVVADELHDRGVRTIVGVDIIPEAKMAAERDRPGIYDDYYVLDLTDVPEAAERRLRAKRFNCLITVAALGFGDIPPQAFIKALDLIETPGWIAMTIKEDFLRECDTSGFCRLIRQLSREEIIQVQAYRRFRHRISATGRPLHYLAMVARKLRDVPDEKFID